MFDFLKNPKFPLAIFITAAITALMVFFLLYLVYGFSGYGIAKNDQEEIFNQRYYLKNTPRSKDPFITAYPNISELLDGPIISADDPVAGSIDARVTITIFSDFSCEYCANQEKVLKEMIKRYGQKVNLLWKDYPDNDTESYSYQAAIAARCAQEQDEFWPYHDKLYENTKLDKNKFLAIADLLKLNSKEFKDCLDGQKTKDLVNNNISEAAALELPGIPFIYVNDQQLFGEVSAAELSQVIEIEIKRNR